MQPSEILFLIMAPNIAGVGKLLITEMARRAAAKNYTWADLSLTSEDNTDTRPIAHRLGAKIYKRYRYYAKEV